MASSSLHGPSSSSSSELEQLGEEEEHRQEHQNGGTRSSSLVEPLLGRGERGEQDFLQGELGSYEERHKKAALDQEDTPEKGYFDIYRTFADRWDLAMCCLGFICAIGNGMIQPLQSVVVGRIFGGQAGLNSDILHEQIDSHIKYLIMLGSAAFVLCYMQYLCFMTSAERIIRRVKLQCLQVLLEQDNGFFDMNKPGVLAARLSEQSNLVLAGTSDSLGTAIQFLSQFTTGFVIAFVNNWHVALVMTTCVPLISIVIGGLILMVMRFMKQITGAYEEAGGVAEEVLSSIQTVASFGGERRSILRYERKLDFAESAGIKLSLVRGVGVGLIFSTIFFCFGIGYFYGSTLIAAGGVDFGGVLTSVMSCVVGSISIGLAAPQLSAIGQAKSAANSLFKILDRKTKIPLDGPGRKNAPNGEARLKGFIDFENVSFRYPSRLDQRAIHNFNLHIEAGKTCALVGRSGCGKSTCIALIERFYDVESGSLKIDGLDIREFNLRWLRSQISLVGQEPLLFDTSIEENIRYGNPHATFDQIIEACKSSNAHDFIMEFPNGYQTKVGGAGSKLSGGQKQRICISRALIKDPSILLLDEATSALDNISESVVQKAIDAMLTVHKRTTVIIAHRYSTIQHADSIVVVDNDGEGGAVVESGTHKELMAIPDSVYRRLVEAQSRSKVAGLQSPFGTDSFSPKPPSTLFNTSNNNNLGNGTPGSSTVVEPLNLAFTVADDKSSNHGSPGRDVSFSIVESLRKDSTLGALLNPIGGGSDAPSRSVYDYTDSTDKPTTSLLSRKMSARRSTLHSTDSTNAENRYVSFSELDDNIAIDPENTTTETSASGSTGGPSDGLDPSKFGPNGLYRVDSSRVWALTWNERWYYLTGFIGSALKGSAQPMLSLVISHIMSHLILIPSKVDGINFREKCTFDEDCDIKHPFCLHLGKFFPSHSDLGSYCTAVCKISSDCSSPGSTCINLKPMGVNEGLCVPEGAWQPGHNPDDVRETGVLAFYLYGAVGLGAGIGVAIQNGSFGLIGERLTKRLRSSAFASIIRQDSSFFDDEKNSVGTLLTRLATDASLIKATTGEYTGLLVENFISLLVAMIIAFWSSWRMSIVVMFGMPLIMFSTWFQHRNLLGLNKTGVEAQQESGKVIGEAISGIRTVHSFCAEEKVLSLYDLALISPQRAGLRNAHICGIGSGLSQFLFFCVYSFGIWYGGVLISKKQIEAQNLNRVFFAMTLSATTIGQSNARANDTTKARVATSNVFMLIDRKPRIDPYSNQGKRMGTESSLRGDIEFRNVTFRYPTRPQIPVLLDVSFKISAGETAAFVGSSGCGKSTIIRLMERFYDPEYWTSKILVDGIDLRDINLAWWRSKIALVGQEPRLFDGTIAENVAYGKKNATKDEIIAACKSSNAHNFIMEFPKQYETSCGSRGAQLSGGQKQRIALARALIRNPVILLLDEATSALDNESERVVQAALDKLMGEKKRTTLIVAHRLSTIKRADSIFVFENIGHGGQLVEVGKHEELLKINGVYARLHNLGKQ